MSNYDIELTSESRTRNTTDYHGWTGPPKQKVASEQYISLIILGDNDYHHDEDKDYGDEEEDEDDHHDGYRP